MRFNQCPKLAQFAYGKYRRYLNYFMLVFFVTSTSLFGLIVGNKEQLSFNIYRMWVITNNCYSTFYLPIVSR